MANSRRPLSALLLVVSCAAACGSSAPVADPAIEQEWSAQQAERNAQIAAGDDFQQVLLNLDKAMDKYVEAAARDSYSRAEQIAESLERFLHTTSTKHVDALIATAENTAPQAAASRARAVGALGFYDPGRDVTGAPEKPARDVLTPLLNALRADDEAVVNNAVFALGVLRDRHTPLLSVAAILEDPARPARLRMGAAWSLVQVQDVSHEPQVVRPVWLRLLGDPKADEEAWVLIQALRGLGRLRHAEDAPVAEPFLDHPTPLVRQAAAIALGYLGNRASHEALVARLEPTETNANVRLAVRKALQALAGGTDRGYDVKQWRRVFADG